MNKVQLSESELEYLRQSIVEETKEFNLKFFFFGSRVKGNHSKFSDVDILIVAEDCSEALRQSISRISESLAEGNFPYKVDLVLSCDIAESYREDIEQNLIEFS
jgi:predicted nucleotidyltransferase